MKNHWILCAALGAGLASSNAVPQRAQDDAQDLEAIVLGLQSEVDDLRETVENSERVTRETIAYLEGLSKTSAEMSKTLDSAEQKGFTAGINPSSRETLLSGWRAQLKKLQQNVPSLEKKSDDKVGRMRGRR